ncbi:DUF6083 domain-containing protein [Streptomyces sp. NPDC051173]|uniref:DUF6083 domain-containing protein n=1 Tax=Streptomyces sp. NPDC051173 TaxID=3155164 RepID=UPI00344FA55F
MGEFGEPRECLRCRETGGGFQDRGKPWGAFCDTCFADEETAVDDGQAADEGATALGPPKPAICPRCGHEQDRCPTGHGRHVLLEPGVLLLLSEVPEELRWFIAQDGRAIKGTPRHGAQCRIAHEHVCGRGPEPTRLPPAFGVVWRCNRVKGVPEGR